MAHEPIAPLCQITTPEPRLIVLQVYMPKRTGDRKAPCAGLGLNPARDGNIIRPVFRATEETRKDIIRHLHKMAEDIRVSSAITVAMPMSK